MNIQSVQTSPVFQARQKFLSKSQLSDAQILLKKMNADSEYKETKYTFSSRTLRCIKIKEDGFFRNNRFIVRETDNIDGNSELKIGKTTVEFDNKTGEITRIKKPFFTKISKVMEKISEYLGTAKDNFDNKTVVEKRFVGIEGLTSKGSALIDEANKKIAQTETPVIPEEKPVFLEALNIF